MTRIRTILWRGLYLPGAEYCRLVHDDEQISLEGTAVLAANQRPFMVRYQIRCDQAWNTRTVEVRVRTGAKDEHALALAVEHPQRWWKGPHELTALSGCADVDLGFTPSTNTLPIRRLNLSIGSHREITAAWVKFPELTVQPFRQRYTRLSGILYRYESLNGSGFRADLEIDEDGMTVLYPGGWERIAASTER